jgi:hypothetical protein
MQNYSNCFEYTTGVFSPKVGNDRKSERRFNFPVLQLSNLSTIYQVKIIKFEAITNITDEISILQNRGP